MGRNTAKGKYRSSSIKIGEFLIEKNLTKNWNFVKKRNFAKEEEFVCKKSPNLEK